MNERDELVSSLSRLAGEFDRTLRRSMPVDWPDVDLTMPQLKALVSLADGSLNMGEIAELSRISHPAATALIDRLVDKGLVTRFHAEHDRRVVVCELTAEGKELLGRFWSVREESLRALASQMSDEEIHTVISAMNIMIAAAARNASNSRD